MMKKDAPGSPTHVPHKSRTTMLVSFLSKIIYIPALLYSIFLPLKSEDIWFYIGLPIALLGLIGSIIVVADWAIAKIG